MDRKRQGGFTLVELLVAIAIIVVLISILIPLVMRSYRSATRIRTQADMQAIATAIEAYKQDFGDIPRPQTIGPNTGAATLGKALVGPFGDGLDSNGNKDASDPVSFSASNIYHVGDCISDASGAHVMIVDPLDPQFHPPVVDPVYWARFETADGADGPGFRTRPGSIGRVFGPYLPPEKIGLRGSDLLDPYGTPILYFAARPGRRDLTKLAAAGRQPYVDQTPAPGDPGPLYNADDNFEIFARHSASGPRPTSETDLIVRARIRIMLGDSNANGVADEGETTTSLSYLLWSAGPDGFFGPVGLDIPTSGIISSAEIPAMAKAAQQCDDIVNFK